jgi:hypothetical protein
VSGATTTSRSVAATVAGRAAFARHVAALKAIIAGG